MAHSPINPAPLKTIQEVAPQSFVFRKRNALSPEICDAMIEKFEATPDEQHPGRIGQLASEDMSVKKTMDLVVSGKPHWKPYDRALFRSIAEAMLEFRETYPYFKGPFKDIGYQMQRYLPGEHYHWHIDGGSHDFSQRQLVALWYLNNVPGPGGQTEFLYQDLSITPEQGSLILFPPFWTHEHRAVTLEAGVKYIATTWIVFA